MIGFSDVSRLFFVLFVELSLCERLVAMQIFCHGLNHSDGDRQGTVLCVKNQKHERRGPRSESTS